MSPQHRETITQAVGPVRFFFTAALWILCTGSSGALAQTSGMPLTESRITQVKVYPGSATVERVARVAAGSKTLTFACLPAGLDIQSLQVAADATVRIGETSVLTAPRALSPACSGSPLDGPIRALEDQKATFQAEVDALHIVTGYLKGFSGPDGDRAQVQRNTSDAKGIAATADALRRTGQDALQKQHQLTRQQADIDRQLQPLLAERTRTQGAANQNTQVVNVTVTLASTRDADIRLSYQVNGPGWTPTYRALLDTTTGQLRLERQALVAQATGEDWNAVKLSLSTGQPRRNTTGRLPNPWRIGIQPPPDAQVNGRMGMVAMAPAPIAAIGKDISREDGTPLFDVGVFNNSFSTEFTIPHTIDVPSNGQRISMALGQHETTAQLAVRTSPGLEPSAYLVADMAPPEGVWPAGPLQLYRDGGFVGTSRWTPSTEPRVTLSFGLDELVRVQAEPERDNQGTGGFVGSRAERRVQRAYVVENRHRTPIKVHMLEAAPVSVNDQVHTNAQFTPQPTELAWNKQPGVALWSIDLRAGETTRVTADYTISYPKDARLDMR